MRLFNKKGESADDAIQFAAPLTHGGHGADVRSLCSLSLAERI